MNPQDRPARRFDEPPAYEDLELRPTPEEYAEFKRSELRRAYGYPDPDIAARSHLGAIVIVAAIVGLALIAVALFLRGAS
jgi:hypothetical protein